MNDIQCNDIQETEHDSLLLMQSFSKNYYSDPILVFPDIKIASTIIAVFLKFKKPHKNHVWKNQNRIGIIINKD